MAVITLNQTTFVQVDAASAAVLVEFRGGGPIQVAQTASPAAGDWITFGGADKVRFPAGTPVFARAPNGTAQAVTRPFA